MPRNENCEDNHPFQCVSNLLSYGYVYSFNVVLNAQLIV